MMATACRASSQSLTSKMAGTVPQGSAGRRGPRWRPMLAVIRPDISEGFTRTADLACARSAVVLRACVLTVRGLAGGYVGFLPATGRTNGDFWAGRGVEGRFS